MRLEGLQVLRGLAATSVLAFHANLMFGPGRDLEGSDLGRVFGFGHAGVDLFFVLSGFIIAHVHWGDARTPAAVRRYIARRLIRIYPIVIVTVLGFVALLPVMRVVTADPHFFSLSPDMILSSLTLLPLTCSHFPDVLWSLQDEMYFYLLFLLFYVDRRLFVGAVFAWAVLSVANTGLKFVPELSACASSFLGIYNALFAVGLSAFFLWRWCGKVAAPKAGIPILALGIGLFAITAAVDVAYIGPTYFGVEGGYSAIVKAFTRAGYALGSLLLVVGAALVRWSPATILGRAMVLLGDASFAIYLVHLPVLGLLARGLRSSATVDGGNPAGALLAFTTMVGASLALGLALHLFVEKPMLASFRKPKVRRLQVSE